MKMSYRFMRTLVLFDLPTQTLENRREYARFRRYLIKSGFMMLQESVYCKIALNQTATEIICNGLRKNKPPKGLVLVLSVTEKQFSKMEFLIGESQSEVINSDERLIII